MAQRIRPLPELLDRADIALKRDGGWRINHCEAARGKPNTHIKNREMNVPFLDTEFSRLIRAHEMMHARISAEDWGPWIDRGIATFQGLTGAEELRVNYLVREQGFDTKALCDNSERRAGESVAHAGDWAEAVYFLPAVVATGGLNQYITGIRRQNRDWADTLRALAKQLEKLAKEAHANGELANTSPYEVNGEAIGPRGMLWTERIGEMLDNIANPIVPEEPQVIQPEPQKGDGDGDDAEGEEGEGQKGQKKKKKKRGKEGKPAPVNKEQIKKAAPRQAEAKYKPEEYDAMFADVTKDGEWVAMTLDHPPTPIAAPGGLGMVRRISNRGRNPRFLHRAMTDPKKRIFESKMRGMGGVIVFDMSGSMHLSVQDIQKVLEAAPGATVLGYKCQVAKENYGLRKHKAGPNTFVLAHRGRMVEESGIPTFTGTNGCDLPALRHGVKLRQHPAAPVLWITDGLVHDGTGNPHAQAGMAVKAIRYCLDNRVMVASGVKAAVAILDDMRKGRKARWTWGSYLRSLYYKGTGMTLPNENWSK